MLAWAEAGKGVDPSRTLGNMLSSQAMCFNIFGNLRSDEGLDLAARALRPFLPTIQDLKHIHLEYTPSNEILGDQTGRGGVDCDVLVEYRTVNGGGPLAIDTKLVEPDFSSFGFRGNRKTRPSCPDGTSPGADFGGCLYASRKGYRHWHQSRVLQTLRPDLLGGQAPCPFGSGLWQHWVNHTLVHAEARRRGLQEASFAVLVITNRCSRPARPSGRS
jgi:hypothetical protein